MLSPHPIRTISGIPKIYEERLTQVEKEFYMRLPDEVIEDWLDIFEIFDDDNSNTIDSEEFPKVMRCLKMNTDQLSIDAVMESIDYNKDGVVDFDEFTVLMVKTMVSLDKTEEELVQVFRRFDKNGDS